ncbi:MAG: hypothetical protein KGK01_01185 [Bradyrhizobium sp.]|uniref:hypothetical protein n=1 Tax=Bradyrhizobium sp. TaxID=376 RepID=UPI001C294D8E|nr:hypothetical protein [Bradyrhizobium sp.]MBU6464001.1 hypothetical protein [Pseudomonadota bacterium]MDE2067498.1 hypothetical protein [Bradyrhizobium sp.]MDE2241080.1 hypothetical protein [Bradyrhizobium sp.]MDE2469838.1 hypothetical protein [Bradyrhizobium sp.]
MAKKNDHLADFETENTGGVLGGFLADEEHLDRRAMWRLGAWGVASVGAIVIAVLTNQSSLRLRRDEFAAADLSRQAEQIQSVARDSQNETRRLAAAIDTLNGDRDRMYSRLTALEQGLDSVTGAIDRQKTAAAALPATPVPASAVATMSNSGTPAASAAHPVAESAANTPVPAPHRAADSEPIIGPVATAAVTGKQLAEIKQHEQTGAKLAAVAPAPVAAPAADAIPAASKPPATTTSQPMGPAKSMMGPPNPAAPKLVEPEPAKAAAIPLAAALSPIVQPKQATPKPAQETTAAAAFASEKPSIDKPATEKAAANAPPAPTAQVLVNRTEFGVDVGGANSVGGLRALWRGLLKSRSNAPLAALQPIIVIKEGTNGLGMQLRLVAGPLTDAAAAAKICAHMVENDRPCTTAVFDGQRLAMRADEASGSTRAFSTRTSSEKEKSSEPSETEKPVAEKPVSPKSASGRRTWHHRYYPKRAVVEEPPKPEPATSTLSSLFSRH